jgi:hypothetical protein
MAMILVVATASAFEIVVEMVTDVEARSFVRTTMRKNLKTRLEA